MQHSYLKLAMQHIDVNFTYFFVVGKYKYKLHDDVVKNLHLNMIENVKIKDKHCLIIPTCMSLVTHRFYIGYLIPLALCGI
jgi:hypothetical protein